MRHEFTPRPDKSAARISWEYSIDIDRDDALVAAMGLVQIDNIFRDAATCE